MSIAPVYRLVPDYERKVRGVVIEEGFVARAIAAVRVDRTAEPRAIGRVNGKRFKVRERQDRKRAHTLTFTSGTTAEPLTSN